MEGVISMAEFKQRNDKSNEQVQMPEEQLTTLQDEAERGRQTTARPEEIWAALEKELSFQNGIRPALVTTILDHIAVKKNRTKEKICLDIHLKFSGPWEAVLNRADPSLCFTRSTTDKAKGKFFAERDRLYSGGRVRSLASIGG